MKTRATLPLVLALTLVIASGTSSAQVQQAWVQRYSNVKSNSNDQAFKIARDAAGDVIVAGTTADGTGGPDILTIKYSGTTGAVIWQKRYPGPPNDPDFESFPRGLAVDADGNVVVTGGAGYPDDEEEDYDYYTVKYAAADGALLWEKRYNGVGTFSDVPSGVALDGSGNVLVTGYSKTSYSFFRADYYTAKYAAADGTLLWEKRYDGPGRDVPNAMAVDASGNAVVTGVSADDYYTAKYAAANGALLWEKRLDTGLFDAASAVALDGSGNVVVTGGAGNDYYTAKYAATNGALLWEKRHGGPAGNVDAAHAVAVDASGNVVVTGYSRNTGGLSNAGYDDFYTAKYAATTGALLWEQRYNGPANQDDQALAVAVDASGNVVVTGYSLKTNNFGTSDYYTAKYAAIDGALLWERSYNGPANGWDRANALVVDASGNVVMTGFSKSSDRLTYDWYTAKYATFDGAVLWEQRYTGPGKGDDRAVAVAVDSAGNVVVTGAAESLLVDGVDESEYYTAKYAAADGALLWEQHHNLGTPSAMALDLAGNVIVTGSDDGLNFYRNDYYTAKYAAADGALLWEKRYNGPADFTDNALAVAVDSAGNVAVTGRSYGGSSADDFYTAKYAAADGALLWERRYNGPSNSNDGAIGVAVDSVGNVVVTGNSPNGTNLVDYYTAKYAATDGAVMWEQRYNGPARKNDIAQALAVDGSGNVAVTGYSPNSSGNDDFYTARYASADGALLWERRYNGPANGADQPHAIAVDGIGNIVVTGYSSNGTNTDGYTAKYAAADGVLLWERRFSGVARAVAVDGSGNAVVTGYASNGTNSDYYTVKYAAMDGALLWEKRYNGPANGDDFPGGLHGLAVGPNGIVAVTGFSDGVPGPDRVFNYATILYREILPPLAIAVIPEGVRIHFTGIPGRAYNIERAPAITGPWSAIGTPAVPLNGSVEYTDTNPPAGGGFYRISAP